MTKHFNARKIFSDNFSTDGTTLRPPYLFFFPCLLFLFGIFFVSTAALIGTHGVEGRHVYPQVWYGTVQQLCAVDKKVGAMALDWHPTQSSASSRVTRILPPVNRRCAQSNQDCACTQCDGTESEETVRNKCKKENIVVGREIEGT
jgi:hypothetical protein